MGPCTPMHSRARICTPMHAYTLPCNNISTCKQCLLRIVHEDAQNYTFHFFTTLTVMNVRKSVDFFHDIRHHYHHHSMHMITAVTTTSTITTTTATTMTNDQDQPHWPITTTITLWPPCHDGQDNYHYHNAITILLRSPPHLLNI